MGQNCIKIGLECNKKEKKTIKRKVIRDIYKRDIFESK